MIGQGQGIVEMKCKSSVAYNISYRVKSMLVLMPEQNVVVVLSQIPLRDAACNVSSVLSGTTRVVKD